MDAYAVGIQMPGPERKQRVVDADVAPWETTYALFMHLTMFLGLSFAPALIMWLIKRNDSPFIDDHGREVLNFQFSLLLYVLVSVVLVVCGIGIVFASLLSVFGMIAAVFGAIAAGKGEYFRYPVTLRFLT